MAWSVKAWRARRWLTWIGLGLLVIATHGLANRGHNDDISGAARVIDGDTLQVGTHRIRLAGIDAPEHDQTCRFPDGERPCGREVTAALAGRLHGVTVQCAAQNQDRYGRTVAYCRADGEDIGRWLVSGGLARAWGAYRLEEWQAWMAGRGLWQSQWEAPWVFRERQRERQGEAARGR
jgi:endonuclease YncB( thermonuclease family)